ncbi:MAG: hypothetical protein EBV15_03365 [Bacteroidetes bacterium]|nr:hypothetical protein [Bacteroidota bacterium]
MSFLIRILPIVVLPLTFSACRNNKTHTLPSGVQWQQPEYSRLFLLGTDGKDSFIALKNPEDTSQWMQIFYWGNKNVPEGCFQLKKRNRVACMTAVFSGMMDVLETETRICCTDNIQYHTGPGCRKWFAENKTIQAAKGISLDREKLLNTKPDLVLTYYIDNKGKEEWNTIAQSGIPVIFLQNYLENHPLGRAEWLKVLGWILGKPTEAESFFSMVKEHYENIAAQVKSANQDKPTVFCNAPYSGNWDVPAGESYMAVLLSDAGADYIWKNMGGTGKISQDIEKVYQKAKDSDFWINPGGCRDIACLQQTDKRLIQFSATKNGGVFNATKTQNTEGGNAWWDYAVVRPDLALHDLAKIFHPDIMAEEQELVFFEALK